MFVPEDKPKHVAFDLARAHPSMRAHHDFSTFDSPPRASSDLQLSVHEQELASQRFVAGEQFYNYEMYGSLRKGGVVTFFSRKSIGLVAAVFSSALSYMCLQSTTKPYMNAQMNLSEEQSTAVMRLVELPMALSFFVGLLMDGYPIRGLRRKGYMILGLILNAVCVLALGCISMYFESTNSKQPDWVAVVSIVLIAGASFGCIITYISVHTRVIELSQREPLRRRGAIIAEYLIFRRLVSLVGACYVLFTFGKTGIIPRGANPRIAFSTAMFILCFVCAAPLPIILRYWKEEHYNLSTTLKTRSQIFWRIMQQKAVWRVLMFVVFFFFFLAIRIGEATGAIRRWCGASRDNSQLLRSISDVVIVITLLVWRALFMNTPWIRFYCWGPILQIVPNVVANILVALDVNQNRYVYRSIVTLANISDGITTLNPVVPLVEIIQEGSEGVTVGLTLTLQRVINIFVNTNYNGIFRGDHFYNVKAAEKYSLDIGRDVLWTSFLAYGINAIALFGLFFLPSQKLDAQQLRMYGGFTKAASSAIVIFVVSLFTYSMVINILTFVPGVSCYRLIGGKGCN